MRRLSSLYTAALFAALISIPLSAAASSEEQLRIWFDTGGPKGESYSSVVQNGAEQACEDLGCDLTLLYSDWNPETMLANIRRAISAKPDGIVIMGHPGDEQYAPLVKAARAKNILVTSTDTELPKLQQQYTSEGFGYTGRQNYQRGIALAQEALQRSQLKAGDRALVWGLKRLPSRGLSSQAMIKTLAKAGINVDYIEITPTIDKFPETGGAVLKQQLDVHPDTRLILVDHGGLTAKISQHLQNANADPDALFVAGSDLSKETCTGIRSGYVDLVSDGQPFLQGYLPIVQLVLSKRYGFSGLTIDTSNGFISAENIDQIEPLIQQALR